ncbi:MAG TPA: hypothetical protein DIT15_10395 [Arthrobacter bacterium]|nr:hypothetical protein [Arthrobacter sp.]
MGLMRLLSLRPTSPGLLAQPQLAGGESDGDVDDYVFLAARVAGFASIMGSDFWPYSLAANAEALRTFLR